jgi:hypothetical protein
MASDTFVGLTATGWTALGSIVGAMMKLISATKKLTGAA